MSDLQLHILHEQALTLFHVLAQAPELQGMTLMGGTALALQLGHRFSLDFDFATFEPTLATEKLDTLVSRLKTEHHKIKLITDPAAISRFRINTGEDLLNHARDYVIDNIKFTFFTYGRTPRQRDYFQHSKKINVHNDGFDILGLEGLKASKTLVLADRARSRDLFDLMTLMQTQSYKVSEAIHTIETLGHNDDPEYYKAVMTGAISLDKGDEGLNAVIVTTTTNEMYAFFNERIANYERDVAEAFFLAPPE